MTMLFVTALLSLLATAYCGKYTVTDEVWFDIVVKDMDGPGQDYSGTFVIAVFGDTVPMTALNFVSIARGYQARDMLLHYKETIIHRVIPDFVIQMGDTTKGDGTGGRSIFGDNFVDESFTLSHRSAGWVAMANHGPDTNGSQFYIMLTKARWLDNKHVVFGKVIQGFDVVELIGNLETNTQTAKPTFEIIVEDCGVRSMERKYDLTEQQLDQTHDL